MNQDLRRVLLNINDSGLGCLLTFILISFVLGSVGLGWVVNGFLIFMAFLFISPVIAVFIFRWWLKRNLVESQCPVCNYPFTAFNESECRCPNCGEGLKVEFNQFQRITPPGTIDIEAVEIPRNNIEGKK